MIKKIVFAAIINCIAVHSAFGLLKLNVTRGVDASIPVAVMPLAGDHFNPSLSTIISQDLVSSGVIRPLAKEQLASFPLTRSELMRHDWQELGVSAILMGDVVLWNKGIYRVNANLFDTLDMRRPGGSKGSALLSKQYKITSKQVRTLAHRISDEVYHNLTGVRGVFSTRIAYVLKKVTEQKRLLYYLMVADSDGENAKPVLISPQVIMSPAWSPDGKQLAYVSFENNYSAIYVTNVASGLRQLISRSKGINGAPSWSPDGKTLALVLSKSTVPQIYVYDLAKKQLTPLTHDVFINTEPSFAPDGRSVIFTSNRHGAPQIYQLRLSSKKIERLTHDGSYNAKASPTPDGKAIVFLHRDDQGFSIAMQSLDSGVLTVLVKAQASESPSVAPNGRRVIYVETLGHQRRLATVSVDSKKVTLLPVQVGDVQEPAWGA